MRVVLFLLLLTGVAHARQAAPPVTLLDVPYISQSEALCGGAAAAMVLRYWGERALSAESFAHLVDQSAAGIGTAALAADIAARGWTAAVTAGHEQLAVDELARGRPVLALIEDRPGRYHDVVIVAWHERGVVFHDPARAPFRVMARDDFVTRWRAAESWMLVVVPGGRAPGETPPTARDAAPATVTVPGAASCDALVARGIRAAQANDLQSAEQALTSALACPGAAAPRELAGVRLLQRRWPEVSALASAALAADPGDTYAWKLLGTSHFVQGDPQAALEAWNHAGEPRVDLVSIDGLARTRHRVVEQLVALEAGTLLTPDAFARARRRLLELPSAATARLEFVPIPSGLAEVRGAVAERDVAPTSPAAYLAIGITAAATRELRATFASVTGGGERMSAGWRFWPDRPRLSFGVLAPAPWGGLWGLEADAETQPFDTAVAPAERRTVRALFSDWATGSLRWNVHGGVERRELIGTSGLMGGGLALITPGDRLQVRAEASRWVGGADAFGTAAFSVAGRSRTARQGAVFLGSGALHTASAATPLDAWPSGDTGHARLVLLRAHPLLDDGRLRVERLGRLIVSGSAEAQYWWGGLGPVRTAGALFVDVAQTAKRVVRPARTDVDLGVGARLAVIGVPGIFRVDLARGLRDGASALSFVYAP